MACLVLCRHRRNDAHMASDPHVSRALHNCRLRFVHRLYSVYGPWEKPGRLLPMVATYGLLDRLPPSLVQPGVAPDFVHVEDVMEAVFK